MDDYRIGYIDGVASRDAEVAEYMLERTIRKATEQSNSKLIAERDEWKARAEFSYKQRDELERERDAFYMDYRMKCDEEIKALCVERDALQADNARLWGALNTQLNDCINFNGGQLTICIMEASTAALAAAKTQGYSE